MGERKNRREKKEYYKNKPRKEELGLQTNIVWQLSAKIKSPATAPKTC